MPENDERQTAEAKGILEGISAIAAKRRRDAEPALERPIPEWLLEIRQTEVVYTINPRMLPITVASFPALSEVLREKYSLHFWVSRFSSKSSFSLSVIGTFQSASAATLP